MDPIESCHLLRCWRIHLSGRTVQDLDLRMLMAYSATFRAISLLLRYDEPFMLRYATCGPVSCIASIDISV